MKYLLHLCSGDFTGEPWAFEMGSSAFNRTDCSAAWSAFHTRWCLDPQAGWGGLNPLKPP